MDRWSDKGDKVIAVQERLRASTELAFSLYSTRRWIFGVSTAFHSSALYRPERI